MDSGENFLFDLNVPPANEEDEEAPPNSGDPQGIRKNITLSNEQRKAIYNELLLRSVDGRLKRNTTKEVSILFSVPLHSVQRIWKRGKDGIVVGAADVSHRKTKNCGRKAKEIDLSKVAEIPLSERMTLRSLSHSLKADPTTVWRCLKRGEIRRHSNAIKPLLKEEHKKARLQFCLSMLEQNTLSNEPKFIGMYNMVHIDEKWFYMTKSSQTYYLHPDEDDPLRSCQSKNFIGKVMFLVAMARPRFDEDGNEVFSGKIGVFPLTRVQPARRKSMNRDVGTLEIKPITSVTRETIKEFLIEKVIPRIQEVWPREDIGKVIFIQQDNARTHVLPDDADFNKASSETSFDIRLMCQPANSPDLNILDLGFFRSIQVLQHKMHPKSIEDLVKAVEQSFDEYPAVKVNYIFLSLQLCMREILKVRGSNKYNIPHINKAGLAKEGTLPKQITCDVSLVQDVMNNIGG